MAPHGPHWFDGMYDNRALVPGHQRHLDMWARASRAAREALAPTHARLDLRYGSGAGETLDIFGAGAAGLVELPVLVFLHGGYWRSLDKSDQSFLAPAFMRSGACVVIPNYALCPGTAQAPVTVSHIVRQAVRALEWVWRSASSFGADRTRITLVGHSAGGHLAAMLLACRWREVAPDLPDDLVHKALSVSGLHDLEPLRRTPFLQQSLRLTPSEVGAASPAMLPVPVGRTLCTIVGADESAEFRRQNRLMRDAWGPETVPVCAELPRLNHFSVLEALAQPGHVLHALALDLVHSA